MSAETLREAAETLRNLATNAALGPWHAETFPDGMAPLVISANDMAVAETFDKPRLEDAAYIATMHPGVGLALAKWLDDIAAGWIWDEDPDDVETPDGWPVTLDESIDSHALNVAHAILGGAS